MNLLVPIALFGWIPIVIGLFLVLPPRRAVLVAGIAAWLFLPMAGYNLPGLPPYTKTTATTFGILIGIALFDPGRLASFRPSRWDLPAFVLCVVPFLTSLDNGLGAYDGLSAALGDVVTWLLPYLIGRLYFGDLHGQRELAIAVLIGGIVYVPLCLFEVRFSPCLHLLVYGYHQHEFLQTKRFGGYRPMVFMQHGLMVGIWMTSASLVAAWMWMTGTLRRLWGVPMGTWVAVLVGTAVLCKSTGALLLLAVGLGVLWALKHLRSPVPVLCLAMVAPTYAAVRVSGMWSGKELVDIATSVAGKDRADSMAYRLRNEDRLIDHALEQKWLGWGRWNRSRVTDERGKNASVADGLWILALAETGLAGMTAIVSLLVLPAWRLMRLVPVRLWAAPAYAPASGAVLLLLVYAVDNLMNAMLNPVFMFMAGGLMALGPAVMASAAGATAGHRAPSQQLSPPGRAGRRRARVIRSRVRTSSPGGECGLRTAGDAAAQRDASWSRPPTGGQEERG